MRFCIRQTWRKEINDAFLNCRNQYVFRFLNKSQIQSICFYLCFPTKTLNSKVINPVILKKGRVVFAVCFATLCIVVFFIFPSTFFATLAQFATDLQFVPSLLKTISISGFIGTGLIVTVFLTFIFGRIYCSVICPLGVFQDFVSWTARKLKFKIRFKYGKEWPILRYSILFMTAVSVSFGLITLLSFLDPFSIFGRTTSFLLKPIVVTINNLGADWLSQIGVYSVFQRSQLLTISASFLILNLVILFVVSFLSFTRGRLYCNTICPVGTLLGLLSKFALFKVKLDKNSCTRCGKCVGVCKAECIDLKTLKVDNSRCVACYNCLQVCPEDAAKYQLPEKKGVDYNTVKIDASKRNFLVGSLAGSASLIAFSKSAQAIAQLAPNNESRVSEEKTVPVSPPGCVSSNRLNNLCTGCSLCISACPTKVMRPAFLEYGLIGMMQPHLDFGKSFCEYDCIVCGNICPTGAIKPLTKETKHLCQTGIAKFDLKKCIVETDHTKCKDCFDHCPASAIRMVPYGELAIPEVLENICNGCGECEFVCPVRPSRAIFVVANPVHQLAQLSEQKQNPQKGNDFPF